MTPEEKFLAERIVDPMLRAREVIEAMGLAVAANATGAKESAAAVLEDRKRAPVVRRLAAAAFFRLAGAEEAVRRFESRWRDAEGGDRVLWGLAAGRFDEVLAALECPLPDEDASGWIAVAHTLSLRKALPGLAKILRDAGRHLDVRRQAAETIRALTMGDDAARGALRGESPRDGSILDELLATASAE
ncbi:MAG: hypothetical protein K8T20_19120 [Planctomycetes bacterium]|nr:hypothetical protein [Planctomycetota bacterium]